MMSSRADFDRPGRYFRVSRFDIRKENEIAVVLVPGERGPVAIVEDPTLTLGRTLRPVPIAVAIACRAARHDLNHRQVVIVDEEGLWEPEWGVLVPHPDRN